MTGSSTGPEFRNVSMVVPDELIDSIETAIALDTIGPHSAALKALTAMWMYGCVLPIEKQHEQVQKWREEKGQEWVDVTDRAFDRANERRARREHTTS